MDNSKYKRLPYETLEEWMERLSSKNSTWYKARLRRKRYKWFYDIWPYILKRWSKI